MNRIIITLSLSLITANSAFAATLDCHGWGPVGDGFEDLTVANFEVLTQEFTSKATKDYKFKVRNNGSKSVGTDLTSVDAIIQIEDSTGNLITQASVTFSKDSSYFNLKAGKAALYCHARL